MLLRVNHQGPYAYVTKIQAVKKQVCRSALDHHLHNELNPIAGARF